jgi:hypothetical protein
MAIDIRAIKIMLDTNIPDKGPIPFTKSMLYNPVLKSMSGFNEYPFFTMDIVFPEGYLSQLPYEKQVAFFFNKSYMERILRKDIQSFDSVKTMQKTPIDFSGTKGPAPEVAVDKTTKAKGVDDDKGKKIEQYERANQNVMILLKILFPTKYPVMNNIMSSFSSVILKETTFNIKLTDFIPSFLKQKLFEGLAIYSYLKIDSKVYTVSQIIWLNDIYNHKEYSDIVEKFDKLNKWKAKEIVKLNEEITRKRIKFKKQYLKDDIKTDELDALKKLSSLNSGDGIPPNRELQATYTEFDNLIDKLTGSIRELQAELKKDDSDNERISNISKQLASYYTSLNESRFRQYFTPTNKTALDKFVTNLGRDIDDILVLEYISEIYLNRPGMNLDFEKDEPKYRDKLKEKYKTYTDFAENIKRFRAPQKESTNIYLQNTIDDFLDNSESLKGIFNFIMNPYNLGKNPIKEELKDGKYRVEGNERKRAELKNEQGVFYKRMDTGVTLLTSASENEPYFEIYLQVNLIGGELNDDNKSLIDCMYKGESLGDRLELLLNQSLYYPWTVKSSRIFFDITEGSAKETIVAAEKEKEEESKKAIVEESAPKELLKQGGQLMTRKIRENYMRSTRKVY